jgi:thioredoxin reductase (NADPH)
VDVLLIERSGLGGQAGITVGLDNFPGFPEGISGQEFSERVTAQAKRFGVEILQAVDVERMEMEAGYHEVYTSDGKHYHSRTVLLATGASYRRLEVPGEDDYIGAGIHFCATCDGPFYKGSKEIVVVGGGNSAVEEGLHLTNFTEKVTLLVRGNALTASQFAIDKVNEPTSRVEVKYNVIVDAFEGQDSKLKTIKYHYKDSDKTEEIHPAASFIFIGQMPNTSFVKDYVEMDKYGFILTGHDLTHDDHASVHKPLPFETNIPGIFVAGDARHGSTKQVASAVGEGAAASLSIREFLRKMG